MQDKIDRLGMLNYMIGQLEESAREIKRELIARGVGVYEGAQYVAEVQHYDRAQINPKLVREMVDPETVSAVTEIKSVDSVVVKQLRT